MKVGLQLLSFSYPGGTPAIGPTLAEIAVTAEAQGFASLWLMDHLFQVPEETGWGGPEEPMLEAYTALGYLAHATQRIRLGALVGGVHLRAPVVLLKAVTTLDVLSGGRAYFGIGAGWYRREADGLGLPFPERTERFQRLDELLRLAHHAWSSDRQHFQGRFTTMAEPIISPMPISRPHPPILIGGGGERTTLRLVARYGDACNILVPNPGESRAKLEVLRRHCDEVGRDYDEIEKTALIEVDLRAGRMRPDEIVQRIRAQADEGIDHVIVNMPDVHELDHLRAFGREILPEVTALGTAAA
ncbi:MAG: LLM class F420-dependent oxidoreductase [Chloroflexi bacterium]|nr:LLM class F420-dependent oxidoreductase [Chloroflexota bacterium]